MIHVFNIIKWHYDEMESTDIYLYEAPDGFAFDGSLVRKFLQSKGVSYKRAYNFSIGWLMRDDTSSKEAGIEKGEFLEWINTQGVKTVEYKMIGEE